MDEKFITRKEHNECVKRMEDEHRRQNHRIGELEEGMKHNNALTIAVEKLACNMEAMLEEQKEQGERIKVLESRDGEMWRKIVSYVATAIISIVLGYIFSQIGM